MVTYHYNKKGMDIPETLRTDRLTLTCLCKNIAVYDENNEYINVSIFANLDEIDYIEDGETVPIFIFDSNHRAFWSNDYRVLYSMYNDSTKGILKNVFDYGICYSSMCNKYNKKYTMITLTSPEGKVSELEEMEEYHELHLSKVEKQLEQLVKRNLAIRMLYPISPWMIELEKMRDTLLK